MKKSIRAISELFGIERAVSEEYIKEVYKKHEKTASEKIKNFDKIREEVSFLEKELMLVENFLEEITEDAFLVNFEKFFSSSKRKSKIPTIYDINNLISFSEQKKQQENDLSFAINRAKNQKDDNDDNDAKLESAIDFSKAVCLLENYDYYKEKRNAKEIIEQSKLEIIDSLRKDKKLLKEEILEKKKQLTLNFFESKIYELCDGKYIKKLKVR